MALLVACLSWWCGSPQEELPPYFVAILQERTLFARDESVVIRVRLGNQGDKALKVKKFPDLLAGLRVERDGVALEFAPNVDTRALFRRAINLEINAHRDFRIKLDRYFPDMRSGGHFTLSYRDDYFEVPGKDIKVSDLDLPDLEADYVVKTSLGDFSIRLNALEAPNHARHFAILVAEGFYSEMLIHRIIRHRIVQMGDPTGTGTGGSGYQVGLEVSPFLKHVPFSVGMARSQEQDSADSQFYICVQEMAELDQHYSVFGKVEMGRDVIQALGNVGTSGPDGNPPDKPFDDIRLISIEITPNAK